MPRSHLPLIILLLVFFANCNETEHPSNLIGGRFEKHGEVLCYDDYWLEGYRDTISNNFKVFLVDRSLNSPVVDSLEITPGTNEAIDYGTVMHNDIQDRSLVVLYGTSDSCFSKTIVKAWKANTETGRFEKYSADGLEVQQVNNCL